MEYDLARARNVDAVPPVEMYWTARTRSFLPRPVTWDLLLVTYPSYLVGYVPYGKLYNCTKDCMVGYIAAGVPIAVPSKPVTYSWYTPCSKQGFEEYSRTMLPLTTVWAFTIWKSQGQGQTVYCKGFSNTWPERWHY
eukprot:scaffold143810_cov72-Attheya_sp.AAC.1